MTPEFNEWWDSDKLTWINPYGEDTPVYWAWEGYASRDAEIESLRQQLAAAQAKIEGLNGRFAKDQDRIKCQAEQLADHLKREMMLRDVVSHVGGMRFSIVTTKMCEAALAATADLKEQGK